MVPNKPFPAFDLPLVGGGSSKVGASNTHWKLVVIYRGLHCPLCKQYLAQLQQLESEFKDLGFELLTASTDGEEKAAKFKEEVGLSLPVAYDLSLEKAAELGLYISHPRNEQETDKPFVEPGLFVLQPDGTVQIVDVSNAPFSRPDLNSLLGGLKFALSNNYPVRGTYAA